MEHKRYGVSEYGQLITNNPDTQNQIKEKTSSLSTWPIWFYPANQRVIFC